MDIEDETAPLLQFQNVDAKRACGTFNPSFEEEKLPQAFYQAFASLPAHPPPADRHARRGLKPESVLGIA